MSRTYRRKRIASPVWALPPGPNWREMAERSCSCSTCVAIRGEYQAGVKQERIAARFSARMEERYV